MTYKEITAPSTFLSNPTDGKLTCWTSDEPDEAEEEEPGCPLRKGEHQDYAHRMMSERAHK
ncbi:hypothetical protein NEUTE2DRAFT_129873 [Neurospora tetrasperma FGSC 2509]|nr:hypothetical protein NEUTE2DRAFT_129873 [Neurospora tetrasperma FGSC 2509]